MSAIRLRVAWRARHAGRLDVPSIDRPDPPVAELVDAARPRAGSLVWLAGGEPTLRADLPEIVRSIAALGPVGLETDGWALASAPVVEGLVALGLGRVRIPFHSARADAHDWLVDRPGAAKRVLAALRACRAGGAEVEAEVVVTRPTTPYLVETVEVLARLGVRAVVLRRVTARGPAADDFVALSPRFGLLEPHLEAAVAVAAREGLRAEVRGFPLCVAPRTAAVRSVGEPWLPAEPEPAIAGRCPSCRAGCAGAPADYVERFGWTELASEGQGAGTVSDPVPPSSTRVAGTARGLGIEPPPVRGERRPATRVAFARTQAARGDLGGDPMRGVAQGEVPRTVTVTWAPDEPTRAIRQRLVRLAQLGAERLRVIEPWGHPKAAELVRECTRLSFPIVEVEGDATGLDRLTDAELRRLRTVARVDAALRVPDAAANAVALRGLERLSRITPVKTGVYAVVATDDEVRAFEAAWARGEVPGEPVFRRLGGGDVSWHADPSRDPTPDGSDRRPK